MKKLHGRELCLKITEDGNDEVRRVEGRNEGRKKRRRRRRMQVTVGRKRRR
jgi:hypothetical protein